MSKISYNKVRGSTNILKGAQEINSVAGDEFGRLREKLANRIQQANAEYRFLIARARDVQIGAASSTSSIVVEDILDDAKALLEQKKESVIVNDIDILSDILPHCLRTANSTEVIAQYIILSNKTAHSIKLSNIIFKQREFAKIILDFLFFCNSFSENMALEIIGKVLYIVLDLLGGIDAQFDDDCKNVLLVLYKFSSVGQGVEEEKLVTALADKMNAESYYLAIETLSKYRCVEIVDGRVHLVESIGFHQEN